MRFRQVGRNRQEDFRYGEFQARDGRGRLPFWRRQAIGSWVDAGVWPAKWIALPGEPEAARTVAYRNCFTLAAPEKFMLGVCADAVYRLWLDGEELATGPELGDVEHTYVDTYELALEAGPHALVAAVSSFGGRGPYAKIEFRHGFLAAVDGACAAQLETNARNWQARRSPGTVSRRFRAGPAASGRSSYSMPPVTRTGSSGGRGTAGFRSPNSGPAAMRSCATNLRRSRCFIRPRCRICWQLRFAGGPSVTPVRTAAVSSALPDPLQ